MKHINIQYLVEADHTVMVLTGADYSIGVRIDTVFVLQLSTLNWCYDQEKGEVYATDTSMMIPNMLGVTCSRVHLWKYIAYLHCKSVVAKAWRHRKPNDYRIMIDGKPNGQVIIEQCFSKLA